MTSKAKILTATAVEKVKPPATGRIELWDQTTPGFGLRVTSKGGRTWVLMKRLKIGDKQLVRFTLGEYPALSLAKAREKADRYVGIIHRGGDPREEEAEILVAAETRRRNTVDTVVAEFIEKYAKRNTRSWAQTEAIFKRHVTPKWGHRPITAIGKRDLMDLLDDLVERDMPIMANRVLAHLRKLGNWCVERGILEASFAAHVKPPAGKEEARERDLSDTEIAELWPVFDGLRYPFGPMFKLLLLLGQRRNEVAEMRWQDVDLDRAEWTLPRELTKAHRTHVVPLPSAALDILGGLPRLSDVERKALGAGATEYVFTTTAGRSFASGYSRAKLRAEAAVNEARAKQEREPMPQWQLHDLRRTVATGLAELGIPLDHIGRVLNHAPKGVTATVYDRHSYLPEKRRALEAWAVKLESIINTSKPTNVVRLDEARG